jgi:hypothetical protein
MSVNTALRGVAAQAPNPLPVGVGSFHQLFTGIEVPDPITFVYGQRWLNRGHLYPRQATLVKVIFLREDLFTDYDYAVIEEWEYAFVASNGTEGLAPGLLEKMRLLRALGHRWFREVLLVAGRRGGKGHIAAACMTYVLWCYMAKGDPQAYYGIDRDKQLVALMFAGKRDQAKANLYGDLVNVISGSECFLPYINQDHTEKLTIYAPNDFVRMRRQVQRGIRSERDQATFAIVPRESTMMAGRGPTSFMQGYDEMAHVVSSGANRSASEVYGAAKPSLDQFGKDAFIVEPSSPWQMLGQFYDNWLLANEKEPDGTFSYPDMLSLQLASWDIYLDWERTGDPDFPLLPEGFLGDLGEYDPEGESPEPLPGFAHLRGAISVYDAQMAREERANPETFKVERRAKWAAVLDAYLNEQKVKNIFMPWLGRPEKYGPPEITFQSRGLLTTTYKGHADPSKVNDKFGFALAHAEYDDEERPHCVFDLIGAFDPADFPDGIIDYEDVDEYLWANVIQPFMPGEFTYDQYNSTSSIQRMQKKLREPANRLPKRVQVFEKTTTRAYDWQVKENAKAAINLDLVHAPYLERAELELRFLQLVNGRVDHPDSGPVQSKDIADCMTECIHVLIGEQINNFLHTELSSFRPGAAMEGGVAPFREMYSDHDSDERIAALSSFGRARGRLDMTPSRNQRGRPRGRN